MSSTSETETEAVSEETPPAEAVSEETVGEEASDAEPAEGEEETVAEEASDAEPAEGEAAPDHPGTKKARPEIAGEDHLKHVLESLVFVADKPVTPQTLGKATKTKPSEVSRLLEEVAEDYKGRGIELAEVAGGWQFRTSAMNAPFVRDFVAQRPVRLTRAQLETLAIVAYRQPVTRPEIEEIRGVDSGSAVKVLADRGLIKILGRKDEPGRPLLYGTTPQFLEFFGLRSLKDLPTLQEFTELSEDSRSLFERKMGTPLDLSDGAIAERLAQRAEPEGDGAEDGEGEGAGEGDGEGEGVRAADEDAEDAEDDAAAGDDDEDDDEEE